MKWHNQRAVRRSTGGQAMVEYVVVTGMTIGVLLVLAVFLFAFKEAGARVLDLIAYEYP